MALEVEARLLAEGHALAFPKNEAWDEATMATLLAMPGVFACVDPVGAFILARVAADEAEILTLGVPPEARRTGRALALVRAALERAARAGAGAAFLEVSRSNAPARALYACAGFREVGVRRRYYRNGTDALILRRELTLAGAAGV